MSDDLVRRIRRVERDALYNDLFGSMSVMHDAADRIEQLEAALEKADELAEWVEGIIEDGCPRCGGDCSAANPPMTYCPIKEATDDLTAYRQAREAVK